MALVQPFRGYRYNKQAIGDFNLVMTQPYDKISPSMQDEYYRRSPYNVVRVTLNIENRKNTKYEDAGATYRQWLDAKVLTQDALPAFYAYYHEYVIEGQTRLQRGLAALLDLQNSGAGIIPHERTLAAPKQDRLQLMRSLESNEDSIYMLYADEMLEANRIMDAAISGREPEIEVKDEDGAIHRIWAITDPEALHGIQDAMGSKELFIADGHHRFETSVTFMNECQQKKWKTSAVESYDKRLVTCFNSSDGVTILPTHRLIRGLPTFDAKSFLSNCEEYFHIEIALSALELWEKMKQGQKENVFGFYPAGLKRFYLLRLKEQAKLDSLLSKHAEAYRRLDVSVLHSLILERYLGIDESKLVAQAHVDYARSRESCIRRIDDGKYQAAFFLNPTPAEQMQHVASLGERMPQKSTDFYPKLLTGLVFMKMCIQKGA